jgi:hypothetical protein
MSAQDKRVADVLPYPAPDRPAEPIGRPGSLRDSSRLFDNGADICDAEDRAEAFQRAEQRKWGGF